MSKKGVELQFHWIFVMIAVALILIFFFSVANKQRIISQERLQLTLATDVENIFTGAIVSRGTAQRLPTPPQGIAFECTKGCDCKFNIGRAAKTFGDKSIFSPELLETQDIIVWALELKLPYRVTNLLYLTNPNVKYYFVQPSQGSPLDTLYKQVVKSIPPLIEYENITMTGVTSIVSEGYQHTKFIFFDPSPTFKPPTLDDTFKREEFSAIKIDSNGINFYENSGAQFNPTGYSPYVGLASIYAAIFSQDKTMYECGLQTVFRKLSYLSQIYRARAAQLHENALSTGKLACDYGNIENPSPTPKTIIDVLTIQNEAANKLRDKLNDADIRKLSGVKQQLEDINRNLVQQSCSEVF